MPKESHLYHKVTRKSLVLHVSHLPYEVTLFILPLSLINTGVDYTRSGELFYTRLFDLSMSVFQKIKIADFLWRFLYISILKKLVLFCHRAGGLTAEANKL